MKIFKFFSIFLYLIAFSCVSSVKNDNSDSQKTQKFAIAIHGGAGTILKSQMSDSLESAYTAVLTKAVEAGHGSILAKVKFSIEHIYMFKRKHKNEQILCIYRKINQVLAWFI